MSDEAKRRFWRGIEEREQTDEFRKTLRSEFPAPPAAPSKEALGALSPEEARRLHRRSFLKAAGFSLGGGALAASCQRGAEEKLVPLLLGDERATPGKSYWYATTCGGCAAGCGILAKDRDGRPIKIEGNPDHPLSRGGVCAVGQASILGLYDSQRLDRPHLRGQPVDWAELDADVQARLGALDGEVSLLSGTITSPSTRAAIAAFLARFPQSSHVRYDALSSAAILAAHELAFARRVLPHYRFDRARLVVGFEADFLGTWISPVEFTKAYTSARALDGGSFCRHVQLESRLSLTGSNADRRVSVSPAELRGALLGLAARLAEKAGASAPAGAAEVALGALDAKFLDELAAELWAARGSSLVVCGVNELELQCATVLVNQLLGNYGTTLDLERPSQQAEGDERELEALLARMQRGEVQALVLAGVNPLYDLPRSAEFASALDKVGLTIAFSERLDETAERCTHVCPLPHFLEAWGDAEVVAGLVGIAQPVIAPLGATRTLRETLARWSGGTLTDVEVVRAFWRDELFPRQKESASFDAFWTKSLQDGFARIERAPLALEKRDLVAAWPAASAPRDAGLALVLYPKVGMLDGRHAHNPWLQELPDPVTKAVWDNYVCVAPALAARIGIEAGDVLAVRTGEAGLELPALLQPGQHPDVVAIAVGYGRKGTDRFQGIGPDWIFKKDTVAGGGTVGRNAFALGQRDATGIRLANTVTLAKTGRRIELAQTQTHHTMKDPDELGGLERDPVHETSLAAYLADHAAGNPRAEEPAQLWQDDHKYEGHRWGLAIDLNRCTGCSACLIGCQSENNVPVVGKDEVARRREMHWIRIDRYYSGDDRDVEVVHQPVMCQHCGNAPCETVCPVLATVHSSEGLNQQVYNRCVGTRYCANNCPYKVRRFNWFEYWTEETRENLALNPDVTTRSRGVMEKCSLCVQRIQEGKAEAERRGTPLADGAIQTACQQSCPGDAIVFGDLNDPASRVAKLAQDPRHYHLLQEMGLRPGVGYLTKVRARESES